MSRFNAGEIQVNATWEQGRLTAISVDNTRPLHLPLWFREKPVSQVINAMPVIFNVCAVAQTVAALSAIEASIGIQVPEETRQARQFLIMAEHARESGLSLLQNWLPEHAVMMHKLTAWYARSRDTAGWSLKLDARPSQSGSRDIESHIAALETLFIAMFRAPLDELQDGGVLAGRVQQHFPQLTALFDRLMIPTAAAPLNLHDDAVYQSVMKHISDQQDRQTFCKAPHVDGEAKETGCFARFPDRDDNFGNIFVRRLAALIFDMCRLPRYMREFASEAIEETRPGVTETARGTLLHHAKVVRRDWQFYVEDYAIVAPTEWNFHPQGSLYLSCHQVEMSRHDTTQIIDTLIKLTDPCVSWKSEVTYA